MLRADGILKVDVARDCFAAFEQPAGKEPARIVLLLEELNFGGTQRQALELALNLSQARFKTEIWTMAAGDDMASLAEKGRIPVVHLSKRTRVGPDTLLNLWRRLRSARVDILVLMTVIPNIWGRLLGRLTRVPIIVGTCRGDGSAFRQHEKLLWPLADHHICNATVLKRQLSNRYQIPESLISVIPNGVNTEFFEPPATTREEDRKIILCIARLVPEKDHHTLITAFGLLAQRHPDAELWIVGDGNRRKSISEYAGQAAFRGRIRLMPGQLDIRPLLWQGSMLVLSSLEEGLPNVVLEAMASGLPVVATDVGGLWEVVDHNRTGLLVSSRDEAALADAMSCLLRDKTTREAFGQEGRRRAQGFHSVACMVRRHEEIFQRLLNAHELNGSRGSFFSRMKWSSRA
jgi:glycosyltransferase involved in cell wall biosynthesis